MAGYNHILKRTVTSLILLGLVLLVLNSFYLSSFFILILIILGLNEFFIIAQKKGIEVYRYFGIIVGTLIPLSIIFRIEFNTTWQLFLLVLGLIILIILQLGKRQTKGAISGISTTIFGIFYVSWLLSFLIRIRYLGKEFLFFLILTTKLSDVGAYLVGSRFGRIPLLPAISPNKTVEGSLGGIIFSIFSAFIGKMILPYSWLQIIFLAISLGILGQLGDLSESLLKRDSEIKDSGNILPGIGGVLDLMDSFLFTAPVFYFYINII